MKAIRSHYLSRSTCLALILILVSGLIAPCLAWGVDEPKTVLVLPFAIAGENVPAALADRANGVLAMALDSTRVFEGMQFTSTAPSVRRAVSEGRIRQVDVQEGVRDVSTALSMGAALGADYVVMASIQSYTLKDAPASVELIIAGQMYEVAANMNPATGEPIAEPKVFRAFGVSGASVERARYTGSSDVLAQEALRCAAEKAALTLAGLGEATAPVRKKKGASAGYQWLLLGLIIAGAAIAVGSGGDDSHPGPNPNALPPTNLRMEEANGGITTFWTEPTDTTLTVLSYQLQRSVDGPPFSRIDGGALHAGSTFFSDINLVHGTHTYQYRIRTVYTNGDISQYANFGALTVTQ